MHAELEIACYTSRRYAKLITGSALLCWHPQRYTAFALPASPLFSHMHETRSTKCEDKTTHLKNSSNALVTLQHVKMMSRIEQKAARQAAAHVTLMGMQACQTASVYSCLKLLVTVELTSCIKPPGRKEGGLWLPVGFCAEGRAAA